jgi:hypothetical protein
MWTQIKTQHLRLLRLPELAHICISVAQIVIYPALLLLRVAIVRRVVHQKQGLSKLTREENHNIIIYANHQSQLDPLDNMLSTSSRRDYQIDSSSFFCRKFLLQRYNKSTT